MGKLLIFNLNKKIRKTKKRLIQRNRRTKEHVKKDLKTYQQLWLIS